MTPPSWPSLLLLLLAIPFLGAADAPRPSSSSDEVEALLRAGNAAMARGEHARAAALYEQAELRATDPGLVAFNLATANYHLARGGDGRALAAAETGYRCCAVRGDPRRAQALFGLGNCLLLRGGAGVPDPLVLRSAIDAYTLCRRDPGCGAELAADARHNQQRARLLLAQAPPSREGAPQQDDQGGEDGAGDEKPEEKDRKNEAGGAEGGKDKAASLRPAPGGGKGERMEDGKKHDGAATGGAGVPAPPVSDRPEAPNLPVPEAASLLEQAARRIAAEALTHRRQMKRPAGGGAGARDW